MKILRFNDDRIGVIKDDNMVVDVSDSISARKAKGPQRVMEEIIEGWRKYRRRFEKIMAEQSGVPRGQRANPLLRSRGRASVIAAFSNYIDRPERTADNFPNEYFYKSPDLVGPGRHRSSCATFLPAWSISPKPSSLLLSAKPPRTCRRIRRWIMSSAMCRSSISPLAAWCGARSLSERPGSATAAAGRGSSPKTKSPIHTMSMVKSWTNGEPRQNYNTSAMAHKIPNQIAWLTSSSGSTPATSSPPAPSTKGSSR